MENLFQQQGWMPVAANKRPSPSREIVEEEVCLHLNRWECRGEFEAFVWETPSGTSSCGHHAPLNLKHSRGGGRRRNIKE
jgi:hypothetical protein